jgi:hypothetical protein
MGATHPGCEVMSPTRAAGIFSINTVADPWAIIPGPLGTQPGSMQGAVWSAILAAGMLPIITVAAPLMMASGNGGCGTGVGTGAAGWIGAWQCGPLCKTLSPNLAAGWPIIKSSVDICVQ